MAFHCTMQTVFLENNKLRTTYLRLSAKIDCGKWERCLRDVEKKRYCVNKMQSATLFVRMQEHEKIIERKEAISKKRRI